MTRDVNLLKKLGLIRLREQINPGHGVVQIVEPVAKKIEMRAGSDNGNGWTRVARRMAVPPGTKDAIMTVGLMGATGTLDIDGLTIDLVPVGVGRRPI